MQFQTPSPEEHVGTGISAFRDWIRTAEVEEPLNGPIHITLDPTEMGCSVEQLRNSIAIVSYRACGSDAVFHCSTKPTPQGGVELELSSKGLQLLRERQLLEDQCGNKP